jgi:DNA helicase-2/ATP-dependent DNA helicase PcrA
MKITTRRSLRRVVLNVIDGCILPTWRSAAEQVEEERRLLYVAMTRARQHLHLVQPMRLFRSHQHRHGDGHILAMRSRFIPDDILDRFERQAHGEAGHRIAPATGSAVRVDVAARMREMWE